MTENKIEPEKTRVKETFTWAKGTTLEKVAFVVSLVGLVAAIVFLVFEFASAYDWPYVCFDFAIGVAFFGETVTHWRLNRKLAIVTGVFGLGFLILGILKVAGVIAV